MYPRHRFAPQKLRLSIRWETLTLALSIFFNDFLLLRIRQIFLWIDNGTGNSWAFVSSTSEVIMLYNTTMEFYYIKLRNKSYFIIRNRAEVTLDKFVSTSVIKDICNNLSFVQWASYSGLWTVWACCKFYHHDPSLLNCNHLKRMK